MDKRFDKSVADAKDVSKKDFLQDVMSFMYVVDSEELKARRTPAYQYII